MTNRKKHLYLANIKLIKNKLQSLQKRHSEKTREAQKTLEDFTEKAHLRPIFQRFILLCKSLLTYQGVLENDLLQLKEELENLKSQVNEA